jgi:hypothetical protein
MSTTKTLRINDSIVIVILILTFLLGSCKAPVKALLPNKYSSLFKTHPAGDISNYSLPNSWEDRIYPLDEIHKDFAVRMNLLDDFSEVPEPYPKMDKIHTLIQEIAKQDTDSIKRLKSMYIYGIYLCKNLGGTGISGFVYDKEIVRGGFILIDGEMISRTANDWITLKETSVFQKKDSSKLHISLTEENLNTVSGALDYILLHELGHIISQTDHFLPDQRDRFRDFTAFSFSSQDWIHEEKSVYDDSIFPERKQIIFYTANSQFSIPKDAETIYTNLEKTPFPTLYASQNPDDHFADSFVSYITIFHQKKNPILRLDLGEGKSRTFENGLVSGRSQRETIFFRTFFDQFFLKIYPNPYFF